MWANQVDLEKSIYLEALKKHNVYRDYLYSLSDEVDNSSENYKIVSNKKIVNLIKRLTSQIKKNKRPHILPILTSSNSDKVSLYDSIKAGVQNQVCLSIPICPFGENILYHIYTCFIEDLGFGILEDLNPNSSYLRKNEAIRALREYQQDFIKKGLLKRWFLEDKFTSKEKVALGISTSINKYENSLEMIKCICDSFQDAVILFFEDIDLIDQKYRKEYKEESETEAETEFLNVLYSFFLKIRNALIILPCIKTLWNDLLNFSNKNLKSVLESNEFEFFDLDKLKRKIMKVMDFYWRQNGIRPPPNPFFPLNEDLLEKFFEKSHGNLRRFFILCIKSIEEILSGKRSPAEIE